MIIGLGCGRAGYEHVLTGVHLVLHQPEVFAQQAFYAVARYGAAYLAADRYAQLQLPSGQKYQRKMSAARRLPRRYTY